MLDNNLRLDELGERRIIEEILRPRYEEYGIGRFGDDCAFVAYGSSIGEGTLVATTDPCPEPMAFILGYTDFYYRGWLLATINLSDLAAEGARPLGFMTSLILTNDTTVQQFVRLLDGIDECCGASGTRVVGGNLKEGTRIDLSGTAIGVCDNDLFLSRTGCNKGDLIVVLGDLGLFWAGVLAVRNKLLSKDNQTNLLRNILTPIPQIHIGQELARERLLTSCIDNSDGLYPSLAQLARANKLQMHISMENINFSKEVLEISSTLGIEPLRLSLGWGDWQLIGTCAPQNYGGLQRVSEKYQVPLHLIGDVRNGDGVMLEHNNRVAEMAPIDSQRFTKDSWFTVGLESYINELIDGPLWKN
jgi:thiamine-monophosphate kinase